MVGKFDGQRPHGKDRYEQKLRLYDGLNVLPKNVSRPNCAVIWIAAITTGGLPALALAKAPWYSYLILFALSVTYCLLAVWREKHAKPKQKELSGQGPPELGISAASLRADADHSGT